MGKPIIASRVPQVEDIVTPDVGILVSPTDTAGFAAACVQLIGADEHMRTGLGNAARQRAVAHYTWDAHVHKIISCMEQA